MKKKRLKSKFLRSLGIRKSKKLKKDPPPIDINDNVGVKNTVYPENWLNKISYICEDGTEIIYNPISNQKATDSALEQLKADTIAGETLDKDIIDNSKMPK